MDLGVISVRYARALLKSALRLKQDSTVYEEMQSLSESFLQLPQLRQTITNPMLDNKNKLSLLETACGGTPSELTSRFLQLVLKEGRVDDLQFMAAFIPPFIADRRILFVENLPQRLLFRLRLKIRCVKW